ncbi:ABC transporter ATP-binding protein [Propionimicrobium lymphophilum]|nr:MULTISPECIES: ABC transporter ATP-binding protein [Propionimicrobium]ETJ97680.1 ABC transporter, ATP-binding protein [Propionimicrobium sp. BV2F7]MDK7710723.1 ABC transporter ATP-binding protein [Propionimicrobium lymphophilum]MDK7733669.1 ABC transporter ATP-binding protein [Propionimicrobium lymphophilum]
MASTAKRAQLPVIRAVDLTKIYSTGSSDVVALDHVDVSFDRGTFNSIMGPSGSGKSTLMHCMAGLDAVTSGQVLLGEEDLTKLPDKKLTLLRRDKFGFIFQSFNLLPTLNAEKNIVLPLELAGKKIDRAWLGQLAESLGIANRLSHRPSELSGGQQQRVAIARALITRPEVIFADEPTGALDSKASRSLLDYMRKCVDELGQTIIMVTHDPSAAAYGDRTLILRDGKITKDLVTPSIQTLSDELTGLEG